MSIRDAVVGAATNQNPRSPGAGGPLDPADLERLRRSLLERARDLMLQDQRLRQELADDPSGLPNAFLAGTDGARDTEADDEVLAWLRHEREELREVRRALERIDEGRYGDCVECGEPIGLPRLNVLPHAALCVSCQGMAEHRADHALAQQRSESR